MLPDVPGRDGMQATVNELLGSDTAFDAAIDQLSEEYVLLKLPRFKVEYGVTSLKQTLQTMGVEQVFQPEAELGRISDSAAFLSDFVVKAVVEVNEEGTTAAASAMAGGTRGSSGPPKLMPLVIHVNRPFLFVVYDMHDTPHSNFIHFIAKVEDVGGGTH